MEFVEIGILLAIGFAIAPIVLTVAIVVITSIATFIIDIFNKTK